MRQYLGFPLLCVSDVKFFKITNYQGVNNFILVIHLYILAPYLVLQRNFFPPHPQISFCQSTSPHPQNLLLHSQFFLAFHTIPDPNPIKFLPPRPYFFNLTPNKCFVSLPPSTPIKCATQKPNSFCTLPLKIGQHIPNIFTFFTPKLFCHYAK